MRWFFVCAKAGGGAVYTFSMFVFGPTANGAQTSANSAQSSANTAQSTANSIAAGTYSGGSFISNKVIYSPDLRGGSITSDTTINVCTDVIVGNSITVQQSLILNRNTISGGIRWGNVANATAIYYDPAGTLTLYANMGTIRFTAGAVYAGSQRLDQPIVVVFG